MPSRRLEGGSGANGGAAEFQRGDVRKTAKQLEETRSPRDIYPVRRRASLSVLRALVHVRRIVRAADNVSEELPCAMTKQDFCVEDTIVFAGSNPPNILPSKRFGWKLGQENKVIL